jgi:hypothetical protein
MAKTEPRNNHRITTATENNGINTEESRKIMDKNRATEQHGI